MNGVAYFPPKLERMYVSRRYLSWGMCVELGILQVMLFLLRFNFLFVNRKFGQFFAY